MSLDPSRGRSTDWLGPEGSEALQKLKRGEITLEQYIDDRVDDALRRLDPRFAAGPRRALLREVLREQALLDPTIHRYLRLATGRAFTPEIE